VGPFAGVWGRAPSKRGAGGNYPPEVEVLLWLAFNRVSPKAFMSQPPFKRKFEGMG